MFDSLNLLHTVCKMHEHLRITLYPLHCCGELSNLDDDDDDDYGCSHRLPVPAVILCSVLCSLRVSSSPRRDLPLWVSSPLYQYILYIQQEKHLYIKGLEWNPSLRKSRHISNKDTFLPLSFSCIRRNRGHRANFFLEGFHTRSWMGHGLWSFTCISSERVSEERDNCFQGNIIFSTRPSPWICCS